MSVREHEPGTKPQQSRSGTPVRPDRELRKRIERLRNIMEQRHGFKVTFNQFGVAALRHYCNHLESEFGIAAGNGPEKDGTEKNADLDSNGGSTRRSQRG